MKITGKMIKEDLARCKSCYLRNEDLRALGHLGGALKAFLAVKLPGTERSEIESLFREAFANVSKMPRVLKFVPKGVPYLKGQEDKLFRYVVTLHKKVKDDLERESLEQMRERKLKIDQLILKGQKLLEEGNLLEAQRNFREAVANHVDEDGLFPLLALRLMDKGHFKASLEYVKGAIEAGPDNARAYDLLFTAVGKLGETEAGLRVIADAKKKCGAHPLVLSASARLQGMAGKWTEAQIEADKALALKPDLKEALAVRDSARKHLGQ